MRLLTVSKTLAVLAVAVVGIASRMDAGIITVPAGLNPGDTYRLVFVTSTTRDAASSNINDYNTFVTSAANSSPGLSALSAQWFAIASTASTDAITNIGTSPTSTGIFLLDGTKVADGTLDLFDGAILNPISIEETGSSYALAVWTGTQTTGVAGAWPLGNGVGAPYIGTASSSASQWIFIGRSSSDSLEPLYAISSDITVRGAGAVPEPGSIALTALGGALLFFARRRKQVRPSGHSNEPHTSRTD